MSNDFRQIADVLLTVWDQVLDCSQPPEEYLQPSLREEVEIIVTPLKKSAKVDNVPAELFKPVWRPW